jgi:hypothetical protein
MKGSCYVGGKVFWRLTQRPWMSESAIHPNERGRKTRLRILRWDGDIAMKMKKE